MDGGCPWGCRTCNRMGTKCRAYAGRRWGKKEKPDAGMLTGRTDTRGEVVSFLAGNVDEMVVGGKLIKRSEEFLGLDEEVAVVIVLDLEENVIDAETVIAHGAAEIGEIGLLAREAFENV